MRWRVRSRSAAEASPHLSPVPSVTDGRGEERPRARKPRLVIDPEKVWIVADDGSAVPVYYRSHP